MSLLISLQIFAVDSLAGKTSNQVQGKNSSGRNSATRVAANNKQEAPRNNIITSANANGVSLLTTCTTSSATNGAATTQKLSGIADYKNHFLQQNIEKVSIESEENTLLQTRKRSNAGVKSLTQNLNALVSHKQKPCTLSLPQNNQSSNVQSTMQNKKKETTNLNSNTREQAKPATEGIEWDKPTIKAGRLGKAVISTSDDDKNINSQANQPRHNKGIQNCPIKINKTPIKAGQKKQNDTLESSSSDSEDDYIIVPPTIYHKYRKTPKEKRWAVNYSNKRKSVSRNAISNSLGFKSQSSLPTGKESSDSCATIGISSDYNIGRGILDFSNMDDSKENQKNINDQERPLGFPFSNMDNTDAAENLTDDIQYDSNDISYDSWGDWYNEEDLDSSDISDCSWDDDTDGAGLGIVPNRLLSATGLGALDTDQKPYLVISASNIDLIVNNSNTQSSGSRVQTSQSLDNKTDGSFAVTSISIESLTDPESRRSNNPNSVDPMNSRAPFISSGESNSRLNIDLVADSSEDSLRGDAASSNNLISNPFDIEEPSRSDSIKGFDNNNLESSGDVDAGNQASTTKSGNLGKINVLIEGASATIASNTDTDTIRMVTSTVDNAITNHKTSILDGSALPVSHNGITAVAEAVLVLLTTPKYVEQPLGNMNGGHHSINVSADLNNSIFSNSTYQVVSIGSKEEASSFVVISNSHPEYTSQTNTSNDNDNSMNLDQRSISSNVISENHVVSTRILTKQSAQSIVDGDFRKLNTNSQTNNSNNTAMRRSSSLPSLETPRNDTEAPYNIYLNYSKPVISTSLDVSNAANSTIKFSLSYLKQVEDFNNKISVLNGEVINIDKQLQLNELTEKDDAAILALLNKRLLALKHLKQYYGDKGQLNLLAKLDQSYLILDQSQSLVYDAHAVVEHSDNHKYKDELAQVDTMLREKIEETIKLINDLKGEGISDEQKKQHIVEFCYDIKKNYSPGEVSSSVSSSTTNSSVQHDIDKQINKTEKDINDLIKNDEKELKAETVLETNKRHRTSTNNTVLRPLLEVDTSSQGDVSEISHSASPKGEGPLISDIEKTQSLNQWNHAHTALSIVLEGSGAEEKSETKSRVDMPKANNLGNFCDKKFQNANYDSNETMLDADNYYDLDENGEGAKEKSTTEYNSSNGSKNHETLFHEINGTNAPSGTVYDVSVPTVFGIPDHSASVTGNSTPPHSFQRNYINKVMNQKGQQSNNKTRTNINAVSTGELAIPEEKTKATTNTQSLIWTENLKQIILDTDYLITDETNSLNYTNSEQEIAKNLKQNTAAYITNELSKQKAVKSKTNIFNQILDDKNNPTLSQVELVREELYKEVKPTESDHVLKDQMKKEVVNLLYNQATTEQTSHSSNSCMELLELPNNKPKGSNSSVFASDLESERQNIMYSGNTSTLIKALDLAIPNEKSLLSVIPPIDSELNTSLPLPSRMIAKSESLKERLKNRTKNIHKVVKDSNNQTSSKLPILAPQNDTPDTRASQLANIGTIISTKEDIKYDDKLLITDLKSKHQENIDVSKMEINVINSDNDIQEPRIPLYHDIPSDKSSGIFTKSIPKQNNPRINVTATIITNQGNNPNISSIPNDTIAGVVSGKKSSKLTRGTESNNKKIALRKGESIQNLVNNQQGNQGSNNNQQPQDQNLLAEAGFGEHFGIGLFDEVNNQQGNQGSNNNQQPQDQNLLAEAGFGEHFGIGLFDEVNNQQSNQGQNLVQGNQQAVNNLLQQVFYTQLHDGKNQNVVSKTIDSLEEVKHKTNEEIFATVQELYKTSYDKERLLAKTEEIVLDHIKERSGTTKELERITMLFESKSCSEGSKLVKDTINFPTLASATEALKKNIAVNASIHEIVAHSLNQVNNSLSNRIHSITSTSAPHGVTAGDEDCHEPVKYGVWAMPLYNQAEQKAKGSYLGYKVKSGGGIIGVDTSLNNDLTTIGAAFSTINSNIKHKTGYEDKTKADILIFSLYGKQNITEGLFVQALASYSSTKVRRKEQRIFSFGNMIAKANYKSSSYGWEILLGYDAKLGKALVTPFAGISYIKFKDGAYRETGLPFANRTVAANKNDRTDAIVGARLSTSININNGMVIIPEVHGVLSRRIKGKSGKIVAKIDGMDQPFTEVPNTVKTIANLGVSVTAKSGMLEYGAGYDLQLANKYIGHQGTLKIRVNF